MRLTDLQCRQASWPQDFKAPTAAAPAIVVVGDRKRASSEPIELAGTLLPSVETAPPTPSALAKLFGPTSPILAPDNADVAPRPVPQQQQPQPQQPHQQQQQQQQPSPRPGIVGAGERDELLPLRRSSLVMDASWRFGVPTTTMPRSHSPGSCNNSNPPQSHSLPPSRRPSLLVPAAGTATMAPSPLEAWQRASAPPTPTTLHTTIQATTATTASAPSSEQEEITLLREQVALLLRSLEEEKKRRASEQTLMQQKILELQGLIRHKLPDQQIALERRIQMHGGPLPLPSSSSSSAPSSRVRPSSRGAMGKHVHKAHAHRSPYKTMKLLQEMQFDRLDFGATDDEGMHEDAPGPGENQTQDDQQVAENAALARILQNEREAMIKALESKMKHQLTRIRARMQAAVHEAQQETRTLRLQLTEEQQRFERRERQLRTECSRRIALIEDQHNQMLKQSRVKVKLLSAHVTSLKEDKQGLVVAMQEKNARIRQLELALGGQRLTMELTNRRSAPSFS